MLLYKGVTELRVREELQVIFRARPRFTESCLDPHVCENSTAAAKADSVTLNLRHRACASSEDLNRVEKNKMLFLRGRIKAKVAGSLRVQCYFFYVPLSPKVCPVAVVVVHCIRENNTEHFGEGNLNVGQLKR